MQWIFESTFARIFLVLERTLEQETRIYDLNTVLLLYLSSLENDFTLIGLLKQCVQSRGTRGVLKIERYAESLTHKDVYERGKLLLMGSCGACFSNVPKAISKPPSTCFAG